MNEFSDGVETVRERVSGHDRVLLVVAGPNGAGKTTFVETFLKATPLRFVNPDHIAKVLSPSPTRDEEYEAARIADAWRRDLVARGESFCLETVFSDPRGAKLAFLREARFHGYYVFLVFIGLDTANLAISRVGQRTEDSGHDVPDAKIKTRFPRTLANLREAVTFVDQAWLFDNSSADKPYRFLAEFRHGRLIKHTGLRPAWSGDLIPAGS